MADLPELNEWTAGVYQLETSDPVLGGPEGIDNLQAKQLANRTLWLKGKLDALFNGTTAAGKATKLATPRAISISGAATGTVNFDGGSNVDISLTLADLSWSKITSGKPTTLSGYGITDGVTTDQVNTALGNKADKATTLAGYGITDALPSSRLVYSPNAPLPADGVVGTLWLQYEVP